MKAYRPTPTAPATRSSRGGLSAGPDFGESNQDALAAMEGADLETVELDPEPFRILDLPTLPPRLCVQLSRTPPASGSVCDLTAGGPVDDKADWIKLDAGGPVWLNLGALSADHRAALVPALEAAGGTFSFDGSGRLVLGAVQTEVFLGANAGGAQQVLDDANARTQDEDIFDFLNGGESVLQKGQADPTGWAAGQEKPGAWYNGYEVVNGEVVAHKSDFDTSDRQAPALDLQGMKDLIKRCLDISGLRAVVGDSEEVFEQALTERFGGESTLSPSAFGAVVDELWSYFTTGAGRDGEVDIGRLQALVRALAPELKTTADTNTPFSGESFAVGDQELARGDGKFGRATMLSLLHLFGEFETEVSKPPSVGTMRSGVFGEHDQFLFDRSPSMFTATGSAGLTKWQAIQGAVDNALGSGPGNSVRTRTQGTFKEREANVGGQDVKIDDSLMRACDILCPNHSKEEHQAFAEYFGLDRKDIFDKGKLDARLLMALIGDGSPGSTGRVVDPFGAKGESPIKAMLYALTHPAALKGQLQQRVAQGKNDPNKDPVRLNGVMDESFQGLEYLELVRALGDHLNVDLRFVVAPHHVNEYQANPVDKLVFIDAADIQLSETSQEATVTYEQGGVQRTETIQLEFPRGRDPGAASDQRYKGAALNVGGYQEQVGDIK